ncbi:MAG: hypothetical protein R3181_07695 [Rubricoccaceae bacterium]|nr:hypothetical protein [Rubricoccaceae bacterium]
MIAQVDELIRASLTDFAGYLCSTHWSGRREHEAKSLYAFGHLVPRCRPGHFLHDPAQIALDTPVPQIAPEGQKALSRGMRAPKRAVAKDLLIWPEPRTTCWRDGRPSAHPAVIMEWKLNKQGVHPYDVDWLRAFSSDRPDFVGYALTIDLLRRNALLECTRVHGGEVGVDWFVVR